MRGCVLLSGGEGLPDAWRKDGSEARDSQADSTDDESDESGEEDGGRGGGSSDGAEATALRKALKVAARFDVSLYDAHEERWYKMPALPHPRASHAMVAPLEPAFWMH